MYRISVADYTYIGSTKDFKQRKKSHKNVCNNFNNPHHNLKVYQIIRENGGWNCCEMIPIEECECEDIIQAHIREEELRKEYNAEMNTIKAYIGENGKKQYNKEYHDINKEIKLQKMKDYHDTNKEIRLQKMKDWYETNKEIRLQKQKEKITCECGSIICKGDKSKHIKTKKHLAFVASNTNQEYIADDSVSDL
jgi:hypothetical protein